MHRPVRWYHRTPWVTALALYAAQAPAAELPSTTPPAAQDARASVPATPYNTAFTGYQPFREQKLAPWREVNDEVHKAGGHIGIFGGASGVRAAPHSPEHKK